jgi:hypothetical protein
MLQGMEMIRIGGQGHELIPYLPCSWSSSSKPLSPLGCYANQQPSMHQSPHQGHRGPAGYTIW